MIQKLFFIMKFNAIELPTPISGSIGIMLNPLIAKINHSCEPNLTFHRPQHTTVSGWMNSEELSENQKRTFVEVIPLRDIEKGEELFNCYVVPTTSVATRKAKLLEDYQFECQCRLCHSSSGDEGIVAYAWVMIGSPVCTVDVASQQSLDLATLVQQPRGAAQ